MSVDIKETTSCGSSCRNLFWGGAGRGSVTYFLADKVTVFLHLSLTSAVTRRKCFSPFLATVTVHVDPPDHFYK